VKAEKNWLSPIDKFNAIFSTSQTQFASLFPEHGEVNQSALVQKPIKEEDYRSYIALYSKIKGRGIYSANSLIELEGLLISSPYLYAAYALYRETASKLYTDTREKSYLERIELVLQNSPPEYRYSVYHAIDRFWLASYSGDMELAQQQIVEAKNRGAGSLTETELNAYFHFINGQYEKASGAYQDALKLRKSTRLLYNLSLTYWQIGSINQAEITLAKILDIIPNHYAAQRLQANVWLLQGKLDLAISAFERLVTNSDSGRDLTNLSFAYGLNKQYRKSLIFAKKAFDKSPKHPIKLQNLADIEMILGNKEQAISHYQEVVTILSGKTEVKYLTYLAQAYAQLNQANLAIEALTSAQVSAPDSGEVSYASAIVYSLLEEKASSIHHVKSALNNNIGVVWFNLPWFDKLCSNKKFIDLMVEYNNTERCSKD
jgi:serine/threonine-protein kinase